MEDPEETDPDDSPIEGIETIPDDIADQMADAALATKYGVPL